MVRKIYVCGVHCSGKTTLINCVKSKLTLSCGSIHLCNEVARTIMQENGITGVSMKFCE